jgi:hypothetical protein
MRHPKIIISGIALAAVAAVGGITTASAASSPSAISSPPASHSGAATVRTASVTVGGKPETILVNGHGLPLYFYKPDTAARQARHRSQITRQRRPGPAMATADLGRTRRRRTERQGHRAHGLPRRPGHLQRPPAVHLR